MDNINIIKEYALLLLTISEWHALIILLLITSSITETIKRVFYIRISKIKKKQYIYGTAFIIGFFAALIGSFIGKTSIPVWFWIFAGTTVGALSNFIHWLTLGLIAWKFPKLAEILKGK